MGFDELVTSRVLKVATTKTQTTIITITEPSTKATVIQNTITSTIGGRIRRTILSEGVTPTTKSRVTATALKANSLKFTQTTTLVNNIHNNNNKGIQVHNNCVKRLSQRHIAFKGGSPPHFLLEDNTKPKPNKVAWNNIRNSTIPITHYNFIPLQSPASRHKRTKIGSVKQYQHPANSYPAAAKFS
ncbi:uncharacterized protein LOC142228747 isoform X1 [Haematobia irritans]|uniref:uncharacterized protein LOC142228747 isoform X1 n=1 Tax=Haematobia irritans TaxID=7368 RepID=UPI003F5040E6